MSSIHFNQTKWICELKHCESSTWALGLLDDRAQEAGISSWAIPLAVDKSGYFNQQFSSIKQVLLPCSPSLELKHPLTPSAEHQLVIELQKWQESNNLIELWGRPLIFLRGFANLSDPFFALKRLHNAIDNLAIISRDSGDIKELMKLGFDGQIQTISQPIQGEPSNYLLNLKQAHHDMEARGCWIPAVRAIPDNEKIQYRNASAGAYQEWLEQATAWSKIRFLEYNESPVWIESWEGHKNWWTKIQSPQAKQQAIIKNDATTKTFQWGKFRNSNIALIVHGFYLDQLDKIITRAHSECIKSRMPALDIYLSTPIEQLEDCKRLLSKRKWPNAFIAGVPNRGRDIAPFLLNLLPTVVANEHKYFIKVHTKQSPHLNHGKAWGDHLISSLLNSKLLTSLNEESSNDSVALLAPKGSLLSSSVELRRNSEHLQHYLKNQKISGQWALQQDFIAGSMMAGKVCAIKDLLNLPLSLDAFEIENGQTDGTLSHSIERIISWTAAKQGLRIIETDLDPEIKQHYGYSWIKSCIK